jgi:hypothetical protein
MHRRTHVRRRAARFGVAAILATALLGLSDGPAGAGVCVAPSAPDADGRAEPLLAGPIRGDGVYNLTGANQVAVHQMQPGDTQNFEVTYRNASTKTRTITIARYDVTGDAGSFVIKYFRGANDITAEIATGKQFLSIPPGSITAPIRVQVRMKRTADTEDDIDVFLRGKYGKGFPGFLVCGDTAKLAAGLVH